MPESDSDANQAIISLLEAHGIPESTGRTLALVGTALQSEAAKLGVEHAALFDVETGTPTGPLRTGRATEVDITDQVAAMRADRRHVSIHTHQTSASFSDFDVERLLVNRPIQTVIAVGWDGTWHLLSKRRDVPAGSAAAAVTAFRITLANLAPDYLALVQRGVATREEALQQLVHTVWQLIAPALGLRYDRSR